MKALAGLGAGERKLLLAALSSVAAASLLLPPALLDQLPEACLLTRAGLPCAGHGLSHGLLALGHGQWQQALRANPLTPFVALAGAWAWSRLALSLVGTNLRG